MRNPIVYILLILFTLLVAASHAAQPVILILGDSLSAAYGIERQAGWVHLLQQRLQQKGYAYKVINASISGNTTRAGLARLPHALKQHKPAIVIIELGGNDGLQGLSLREFQNNLSRMTHLSLNTKARVLLCGVHIPPNLGPEYGSKFHRVYSKVASQQQVPLVSNLLKGVAQHTELMQEDGIHPGSEGQSRILENVWEKLVPLL